MIDIKELRIGNKVKVTISNDAGIYEVLGIPAWGMDGYGNGKEPLVIIDRCPKQEVAGSKLKPILLTRELLIAACDFAQEGSEAGDDGALESSNAHTDKGYSFLWIPKKGRYTSTDAVGLWVYREYASESIKIDKKNCKYLHQLQNIVWSFTNEELNINLNG